MTRKAEEIYWLEIVGHNNEGGTRESNAKEDGESILISVSTFFFQREGKVKWHQGNWDIWTQLPFFIFNNFPSPHSKIYNSRI